MAISDITFEDFEELEGSPTFEFTRRGATAQQMFKVAGDKWEDIVAQVIPSSDLTGEEIDIPPAYSFPGFEWLIATKVKVDPWDTKPLETTPATYEYVKLTITYETPEFDQQSSRSGSDGPGGADGLTGAGKDGGASGSEGKTFVSHKVSIGGEFLTWPSSALKYGSKKGKKKDGEGGSEDKIPEDMQLGMIIPMMEHSITWHFVSYPPWNAIRWLIGNVNAYWFAGCPPETLLFHGCEASREIASDGVRMWTLEYKFSFKNSSQLDDAAAFGWNHFLRPDGPFAGCFEIVNRRAPGGYTTLKEAIPVWDGIASTTIDIKVASLESFSRDEVLSGVLGEDSSTYPMYLLIDNEVFQVLPDAGSNPYEPGGDDEESRSFTVKVERKKFITIGAAHSVGAVVQQVYIADVVSINKNRLTVSNGAVFPQCGQFFLQVYRASTATLPLVDEMMVVARRYSNSPNNFYVVRNVRTKYLPGSTPLQAAIMRDCPMYPMNDFRWLFASGLQTG